ncbi:ubiquinone anaerobic biosynthesis protein UbiU [Ferrimonas balearica]|uniref:ubiquinone anaerobic biosynthesis protein UbiU n=1 Tax=Ferrimonas balearica TaxID=44012 RepID=UPI001C5A4F73|nr:peptidase U32 family protein [Ferrimonas balearica]MBW3164408.1 U32 family peptidase [Ferrimonas balearica]MBY6224951.1 U32 family peptidase [Ferrimonas balearica]
MELLAPVGNLAGLAPALAQGADAVYVGLKDDTNARRFAGLNFTPDELAQAAEQCRQAGRKLYVAINTFPQPGQEQRWHQAVDRAAEAGISAVIMADPGLLAYAADRHPDLERHLSVQASAANLPALKLFHQQFGITRAVLPRVLDIEQIERIAEDSPVELEVFASGSLCVMAEGRCQLSTWVSGHSPNSGGACSPASLVSWMETPQGREARLNGRLLDRVPPNQPGGYPTVCKGRYLVEGRTMHPISSPCSLSTLPLLPRLAKAGVAALKLEGRQRSAHYSAQITAVWRRAIDAYRADPEHYRTDPAAQATLRALAEGQQLTTGPYLNPWQ